MTDKSKIEVGEAAARVPRLEHEADSCVTCGAELSRHYQPCSASPHPEQVLNLLLRLVSEQKRAAAIRVLDRHLRVPSDDGRRVVQSEAARAPREPLEPELLAAAKVLRIDANRLCDRMLGGSYEADCRLAIKRFDEALAAARSALPLPMTPRRCFKCDAPATHVCRHPRGGGLTALADAYFCAPCSQTHAALHACLGTLEPLTALPRVPEPDLEPSAREQQIGEVLRVEYLLKAQYGIHHDHLSDLSFLIVEVEALRAEVNTLRAARAGAEAPRLTTNDDQAPRVDHSGS